MYHALVYEKMLNEFFLLVKHHLREQAKPGTVEGYSKWTQKELMVRLALKESCAREELVCCS